MWLKKLGLFIASVFLFVGSCVAATVSIDGPDAPHLSTLQVKSIVKKQHRGRIIYAKRRATPKHPNCHVIKMITTTGEFLYIRYACS